MVRLILMAALMGAAMPLLAQEQPVFIEQPRCWLGAMSYSPGATVRAGNAVMVCTPDSAWVATGDWAAGCLYEGKLYGVGSTEQSSAQQPPIECQRDGTWSRVATGD